MASKLVSALITLVLAVSVSAGTVSQPYDTIVIGLGSSGVTAATTLARAGKRVLGLEAQNRIGGRVNTVPFGEGVVELGAEWIHGTSPSRVYDLAVQNNVTVIPQELDFEVLRSDGTLADQDLLEELITFCLAVEEEPPKDPEPMGHFVTRKLKDYLKEKRPELLNDSDFLEQFLDVMNLLMSSDYAVNDWNDITTGTKYEDLEGHKHMSWHTYGYKTFFEILLNKYNNGPGLPTLETKLNAEVTQIAWPQEPARSVLVTCKDGAVYTAGSVIVTVSLGVLKERHTTLFSPQLPQEKQTAIDKISFGVLDKVILSFPHTNWKVKNPSVLLWRGEDKKNVEPDDSWTTKIGGLSTPMGMNNTLTLWISGDSAKLVETLPEDVVMRKCMELLRKFMGANTTIPEPTAILRSSWYTNPYTRGSYSYDDNLQVSQHPRARAHLAAPLPDAAGRPRVLFAGEATDETHFSTVHGASDTGYREAMRLLAAASKLQTD